jgi:hypothetical protein
MTIEYQQLQQQNPRISVLEVQSYEMNVYLVKVYLHDTIDGQIEGMLYHQGKLMRFHSSQQIRDAFEAMTIEQAVLLHESPYDEMIGNPPSAQRGIAVPFSLAQPY